MSTVDISFECDAPEVSRDEIERAVLTTLSEEGAELSLSLVVLDDDAIHRINREFLQHDYPTDVITFDLRGDEPGVDAEVVVSIDTARREAKNRKVSCKSELLLYCIHGCLHLLGYDDHEPDERARMHERQSELLALTGHGNVE